MEVLRIVNEYGLKYVVKLHKSEKVNDPIVCFHDDERRLDSPTMFSYYTSTILEHNNGLLLYASNSKTMISREDIEKVKEYIKKNRGLLK